MATDKGSLICTTGVVAILGLAAMWSQPTSYISGADQSGKDGSPKDNKTKRLILKEKSKDPPARKFVGGMTARPRPVSAPAKSLTVGEEISTRGGERQRFLLPDASIIYVNESTKLKLNAERELSLSAGEIFLASCPIAEGQRSHPWIVRGGDREISALGAKLVVQSDAAGSRVVVVQGRASVNGFGEIPAGKQIALASNQVSGAPRISRLLGWIKEPMIAAEAPLVPSSKHAGGALIAVDPSGREQSLSLRKYRIDVHIEDGFARTTIDQTYFNHSPARLEGTFYFPLPADASLSRLAMYVDGTLMEGGMAERDYARQTFESIVAKQKDPALLEWVDGQTFKMRVFPLEGRQEKRIILSYTQRLPNLFDHAQYLFPSGHSLEMVGDWSFHALIKDGASLKWSCPTHALRGSKQGNDLIVEGQAHQVKLERDLVLNLIDTAESKRVVRFTSAEHETGRYLMLRYRPGLPGCSPPSPRDWVFLFESSADRDPPLARAQIEVIRHVLANANPEDTFAILTAGTRVQAMTDKPLPVTAENIRRGIEFLEHAHLIGALDLGRALTAAAKFLRAGKNPYLFQLGSAVPAMGERDTEELVRLIPTKACYIGVDVGKSWSRAFMKSAAERHNGYFTQINPTEPISWRTFELMSTLDLPRLMNVKVTDEGGKTIFLTGAPTLTQGEDLCAVAQFEAPPKEGRVKPWMPKAIKVTGTLEGQPLERIIPVDQVTGGADYLPRFWTKLGIDRLLTEFNRAPQASPHEENIETIKSKIIELSKAMYVMSPFTSLLVLENEEMYKQYQVDRGRKDHWAMYPLPAKIPVVREPVNLDGRGVSDKAASVSGKPSAQQVLQSIEVRQPPPILAGGNSEMPPMYFEHLTAADAIAQNDWRPRYVDNSLHLMARRPGGLGFGGLGLGGLGGGGLGLGGGALGLGGLGLGLGIGGAGNGLGGFQGFGGGGMVGLGIGGGLGGLGFAGPIPLRPVGPTGGPISWRFWWEQPEDEDDDEDPAVRRKIPDRPHEFSSRDERERIRHMREKLAQVISVEFEPNIPLQEALNSLRDRYDLNFVLDVEAFRTDRNEPDIEHFPIKLPRMSNVRLGTVLSLMLSRVHGRIAIHADFIEVTTRRGVRTELEEDGFESYWGEIFARRNLLERWRHGLTYSGGMLSFEGGAPNVQLLPSTSWKVGRGEFNNESGGQPAQPSPATGGQNYLEHFFR